MRAVSLQGPPAPRQMPAFGRAWLAPVLLGLALAAPAASAAIPKADFDWKPLLILLGLIVLALPAIGSPSSWLTLTAAGIALDATVRGQMAVTTQATGANQVWKGTGGPFSGTTGWGIGIAVID